MGHVTISDIAQFLGQDIQDQMTIKTASPLPDARVGEMSLVRANLKDMDEALSQTKASLIIADMDVIVPKCYSGVVLRSANARLDFMRVLERFFSPSPKQSIHPSVVIGENVTIGRDVVIHPNVTIYDNVVIGDYSIIHAGCVIGADGFGFERNDDNDIVKFPHIGGVVIGENVEIMGLTHVARGTLGDTIIGAFTKIDAQCHIAHNVKIGERCLITAGVTCAGSVTIGNDVYIAPASSIINKITIGDNAFIGMASFVSKDVAPNQRVIGSPARPMR